MDEQEYKKCEKEFTKMEEEILRNCTSEDIHQERNIMNDAIERGRDLFKQKIMCLLSVILFSIITAWSFLSSSMIIIPILSLIVLVVILINIRKISYKITLNNFDIGLSKSTLDIYSKMKR